MCISGIYAFTNSSILKYKNDINTGAIKIELKEYTIKDGQESIYTDSETTVLPGQIISLIPKITNLGDSSYVRAKLNYTSEDEGLIQITDENISGMDSNWVKKGGYWYYKNIVNSGDNIEIFKNVRIPIDVPNEFQGKSINMNIVAEAIQASNFNPDFNSNSPWNGIEVKKADTTYQSDMVQINPSAVIEYENSANLYIDVPEKFFSKLGHVVPGDVLSEKVSINNKKDTNIEYFVSTENVEGISDKGMELLKKLKFKITSQDGVIYDGNLDEIKNVSLGKYKPNQVQELMFIITVPSELDNEYANISTGIKWDFSVSETEKEPEPVPEPEKKPDEPKEESPQTGDVKFIIAITVFFISAIALVVILFIGKKQKDKNK